MLPDEPVRILRQPWATTMPAISGNTNDEDLLTIAPANPGTDVATYRRVLSTSFGPDALAVEKTYPATAYPSPVKVLSRIYSDHNWICPTAEANRAYAGTAPVWTYLFADPEAPPLEGPLPPELRPASTHGSDAAYLFWTPDDDFGLTPDQRTLGDRMVDYWVQFAHTGNPNDGGLPTWPRTTTAAVPALHLAPDNLGPVDLLALHHCQFWRTL